jgi:hypothetical protein
LSALTVMAMDPESEAQRLEREAARALTEALTIVPRLHERGQRELFRLRLARAIEEADRALVAISVRRVEHIHDDALAAQEITVALRSVRATLAKVHAARAEDASHGAGQLSLSAQRAPTRAACDEGWGRVEQIVLVAEDSARIAASRCSELEMDAPGSAAARAARSAAHKANVAAVAARRIVDQRNHAFTFHTDTTFSFGEGWYVAAAALLASVAIQIEPGTRGTAQAERFLRDAGLSSYVVPYRSRPRAMKQATELVAAAFRANAARAQQMLRGAFLGETPVPSSIVNWIERRMAGASDQRKVLLWIREGVHDRDRNTMPAELAELTRILHVVGLVPVFIGDRLPLAELAGDAVDMTYFWKDETFQGIDMRRAQLQFFEHLRQRHRVVGQLGVTTAGMDGPALLGLPTMYLTESSNDRMRAWVGAVPGYEEVVRDSSYLKHVNSRLLDWADARPR